MYDKTQDDKEDIKEAASKFESISTKVRSLRLAITKTINENFTEVVSSQFNLPPEQEFYNVKDAPTKMIKNFQSLLNFMTHFEKLLLILKNANNLSGMVQIPAVLWQLANDLMTNYNEYLNTLSELKSFDIKIPTEDFEEFAGIIKNVENVFNFKTDSLANPSGKTSIRSSLDLPAATSKTISAVQFVDKVSKRREPGISIEIKSLKNSIDKLMMITKKNLGEIEEDKKIPIDVNVDSLETKNFKALYNALFTLKENLNKFKDTDKIKISEFKTLFSNIPTLLNVLLALKKDLKGVKIGDMVKNYLEKSNQIFFDAVLQLNELLKQFSKIIDLLEEKLGLKKGLLFNKLKLNEIMDNVTDIIEAFNLAKKTDSRFGEERLTLRNERIEQTNQQLSKLDQKINELAELYNRTTMLASTPLGDVHDLDTFIDLLKLQKDTRLITDFTSYYPNKYEEKIDDMNASFKLDREYRRELNEHFKRILNETSDIAKLNKIAENENHLLTQDMLDKIQERVNTLQQEQSTTQNWTGWLLSVGKNLFLGTFNKLDVWDVERWEHQHDIMEKNLGIISREIKNLTQQRNSLQHRIDIMKSHQMDHLSEKFEVDKLREQKRQRVEPKDQDTQIVSEKKKINVIYSIFNNIKSFFSNLSLFGKKNEPQESKSSTNSLNVSDTDPNTNTNPIDTAYMMKHLSNEDNASMHTEIKKTIEKKEEIQNHSEKIINITKNVEDHPLKEENISENENDTEIQYKKR